MHVSHAALSDVRILRRLSMSFGINVSSYRCDKPFPRRLVETWQLYALWNHRQLFAQWQRIMERRAHFQTLLLWSKLACAGKRTVWNKTRCSTARNHVAKLLFGSTALLAFQCCCHFPLTTVYSEGISLFFSCRFRFLEGPRQWRLRVLTVVQKTGNLCIIWPDDVQCMYSCCSYLAKSTTTYTVVQHDVFLLLCDTTVQLLLTASVSGGYQRQQILTQLPRQDLMSQLLTANFAAESCARSTPGVWWGLVSGRWCCETHRSKLHLMDERHRTQLVFQQFAKWLSP